MPHHLVARSLGGRPLFRTWEEGLALWVRLVRHIRGLRALLVMPDHVHAVASTGTLEVALQAYAQWRNHHRGERGPLWEPAPPPEPLVDHQKLRRSIRYVHLNACRARLTDCPLAWPLSAHRDQVGLSLSPAVRPHPDPARLHRYVSSDPSVAVQGTDLPWGRGTSLALSEVEAAVSALTRTTLDGLRRRTPGRRLALAASAALSARPRKDIAAYYGVHPTSVGRARASTMELGLIERVAGDRRFGALHDERLHFTRKSTTTGRDCR